MTRRFLLPAAIAAFSALLLGACSEIAVTDGLASDDVQLATGTRSDTAVLGTTTLPEAQPAADISFVDASTEPEAEADGEILTLDDEPEVAEANDAEIVEGDEVATDDAATDTADGTTTETTVGNGLPGDAAVVPTGTWTPANAETIAEVFRLPAEDSMRTLDFGEVVRTTGRAQKLGDVLWAEVTDTDGVVGWVAGELLIEAPDPELSPTTTAEATATSAPTVTPEPEDTEPEPTATPEPDPDPTATAEPTATTAPEPTATPDPNFVVLRELVVNYPGLVFVTAGTTELTIYEKPDPTSVVLGSAVADDQMIVAADGYFYEEIPYVQVTFGDIVGWTNGSFLEVR